MDPCPVLLLVCLKANQLKMQFYYLILKKIKKRSNYEKVAELSTVKVAYLLQPLVRCAANVVGRWMRTGKS